MYSLTFPNHLCSITSKVAQHGRVVGELNNMITLDTAALNTQHSTAQRKGLALNTAAPTESAQLLLCAPYEPTIVLPYEPVPVEERTMDFTLGKSLSVLLSTPTQLLQERPAQEPSCWPILGQQL